MKLRLSTHNLVLALLLGIVATSLVFAAVATASPVSQKKARLQAVKGRLDQVYNQSEIAIEKYNQATSQLATVQEQIRQNQHLLDVAQHNLHLATEQLKARAQDIYKSRDVGILDVMLSSASFDDLVTQLNMMERLGNSDVDTVRSIAAYRRNIKNNRVKLEADKKAATRLVADRAAQKDQILALQARLEKLTKGLKAQIKQMQAQAALRAKLALIGYSGVVPKVDPNSPGHPEIVAIAQRYLGVPYVWGGASPSGFDCSGLVMYCYAQIGIELSHGATDQQRSSTPVPLSDLRPGDLVFFGNASFSHHVAIFVGGTTIIEAPHTGAVVCYGSYAGRDAWIGGRL
ncbi:MAG TPA: NlpC/P60 family protein [Thermoleophilia bacterium]|nr:NlpC/P60 family protein [Thermoleophilia bacterium]